MLRFVRNLAASFFKHDPLELPAELSNVSCHKDPFNITPAANAIMAAEERILERIPSDQKLVILMGENHSYHVNKLLMGAILKEQTARQKENPQKYSFALGYEGPYNITKLISRQTILNESERDCPAMAFAALTPDQKYESQDTLFKICLAEKISTRFNDIASVRIGPASLIDVDDPLTKDIIQKHRPDLAKVQVILRAPMLFSPALDCDDGLALSNLAIVQNAMDHLKETNARIYIQHCGTAHMFAPKQQKKDFSLKALFEKQGAYVLPVFTHYEHTLKNTRPDRHEQKYTLKISGLDKGDVPEKDFAELRKKVAAVSGLDI